MFLNRVFSDLSRNRHLSRTISIATGHFPVAIFLWWKVACTSHCPSGRFQNRPIQSHFMSHKKLPMLHLSCSPAMISIDFIHIIMHLDKLQKSTIPNFQLFSQLPLVLAVFLAQDSHSIVGQTGKFYPISHIYRHDALQESSFLRLAFDQVCFLLAKFPRLAKRCSREFLSARSRTLRYINSALAFAHYLVVLSRVLRCNAQQVNLLQPL